MSTVNTNRVKYGTGAGQGFGIIGMPCANATSVVAQGDMLYLSAGIVKPVTSDANAATFAGIALQPSAPSSNLDNSSVAAPVSLQVAYSGLVANLKTTAAETYAHNALLYVGADAQTVTTVSGSNPIGRVASLTTITGAVGVDVPVLIKSVVW